MEMVCILITVHSQQPLELLYQALGPLEVVVEAELLVVVAELELAVFGVILHGGETLCNRLLQ